VKFNLFNHADGEPWAIWTEGHVVKDSDLPEINKELAVNNYKPVEYLFVEYGYAKKSTDAECTGEEYVLTFCLESEEGSFPVTFVKGHHLEIV
jgi:hypothetical protein